MFPARYRPVAGSSRPHGPWRPLVATLLLAFLLSACGAARGVAQDAVSAHALVAASAPAAASGAAQTSNAAASRAVAAPVAGGPAAGGATGSAVSALPSLASGQMLIRSGQIELEAADPSGLVPQVRQIAASAAAGGDSGYVADEQLQASAATFTATITIAVPAPTFATVMDQLRRLSSHVLSESSSSQDVTEQFVDVDAQLQALRATQAQLLQLLGKTQQVAETLSVQRELSNVNTQINQLEGRENYLKAHSAFSSIVITIRPPAAAAPPAPQWNPARALFTAIAALGVAGQGVVVAVIWLLVFGVPIALVGLLGLAAQRAIARALRARRRAPAP
jgi:predicted small secreted protein